jgi:hypothetical protein
MRNVSAPARRRVTTWESIVSAPGFVRGGFDNLIVCAWSCQVRVEEQGGEDYAGPEPTVPLAAPSEMGG